MYEYLDWILKRLVLRIQRAFRSFYLTSFDELNVVPAVQELYRRLEAINREEYMRIALYYYRRELEDDEAEIEDVWVDNLLGLINPVVKYAYSTEAVRKRDRLVEALIATNGSRAELDTAMRYWVRMTDWFAVDVADAAVNRAREERGIARVRWRSEDDSRVCSTCKTLNGIVFPLEKVPDKPHPNCRCWLEDVKA